MNCHKIYCAAICFLSPICSSYALKPLDKITDKALRGVIEQTALCNENNNTAHLKITTIIAENKDIAKIDGIEIFENLKKLSLKGNIIGNADAIAKLKNLQILDISSNVIKRASWTTQLTNLQYLNLSNNRIKYGFLLSHDKLIELDISHNHIQQLNGIFKKHIFLKSINASNNPIHEIPSDFLIPFLEHLDISNTNISSIENLKSLKSLKSLNISNCQHLKNAACIFHETQYGLSCALEELESLDITESTLDSASKTILDMVRAGNLSKQFKLNTQTILPKQAQNANNASDDTPNVYVKIDNSISTRRTK